MRRSIPVLLMFVAAMPPTISAAQPAEIAAPGETAVLEVHAEGAQIYECKSDPKSNALVWQFREPIASLFREGKTMGRHYAGPTWEIEDGSAVVAQVAGRAPGASQNDIPLLKLKVTDHRGQGALENVSTVQRINTKNGVAAGPCNAQGEFMSVPYAADYVFLRKAP